MEIFHNTESTKDKMLEADANLGVWQFVKALEKMLELPKLSNQAASTIQVILHKFVTKK